MKEVGLRELQFYQRDVKLRLPFRFGVVTLTEAPQIFVRAQVAFEGGGESWGVAAELLSPKWFDKNPALSNEENFEQLRNSLSLAAQLYTSENTFQTPFSLFAGNYQTQVNSCRELGLNSLIAGYGPSLLDRAILDALCRRYRVSFYDSVRENWPGVRTNDLLPELGDFDIDRFLKGLSARDAIYARHTVGLSDPVTSADQAAGSRVEDGFPETLEEVIERYQHTYFKVKVVGRVEEDVERLSSIATVLDRIPHDYFVTLDGNEQYEDVESVDGLWCAMEALPLLRRFLRSILFIEQPITRQNAFGQDVRTLGSRRPVIIDESDSNLDSFLQARQLGYRGVSSKTCKGIYRSLINAARCSMWNSQEGQGSYFITGEDLSTQAGISVQQDLAWASLLGLDHLERNGHHYVKGMSGLPESEQMAFLSAHPDLYTRTEGVVCLNIQGGRLKIGSLNCPGYAVAADPDWTTMRQLEL